MMRPILPSLLLAVLAVEAGAQEASDDAAQVESDRTVEALSAEIAAWVARDMRSDPEAAKDALLGLKAEADRRGDLPLPDYADLLTLIGTALFSGQNYVESADWFAQSAAIYERAGGPQDKLAEALNNRAVLLRALKRLDEAEATMRRALAIRRELYGDEHVDVASSMFSLANILYSQGRYEDALAIMREAVRQQRELAPDDHARLVQRITGLGAVLNDSGRDREALAMMREAERIGREHLGPDHQTYATVLHNLGLNLQDTGMHGQAVPILREALSARERIHGREHQWTAATLSSLATSLERQGALAEADVLHARALAVFEAKREVVGSETIARTLASQARVAAELGDWEAFDQRIGIARSEVDAHLADTHPMRIDVHILEAAMLERRGRFEEALAIAEQWVPIQAGALIPTHRNRIFAELLLARLRQATGTDTETLWPEADIALLAIERTLGDLTASARERASQAEAHNRSALLYLAMAVESGDAARIFRAAQIANLSDLSLVPAMPGGVEEAELSEAERLYRDVVEAAREEARLSQWRAAALQFGDTEAADEIGAQLDPAVEAHAALEAELRFSNPDFLQRIRPSTIALEDAAAALSPTEELLLLVEGAERGWAISLDSNGALTTTVFDSAQVARDVAAIRVSVDRGMASEFPLDASARLYRAVFGDRAPSRNVRVFGGRSLATIPLGLLVSEASGGDLGSAAWLARSTAVSVIGNLSLQLADEVTPSIGDTRSFAGIGGVELPGASTGAQTIAALFRSGMPDGGTIADLPSLPAAAEELRRIAEILDDPDAVLLVGPDASEERFKATDLSHFDVMAFATHGLVAGELGGLWEPALLLGTTGPDSGEDGLLGASEIARLRLSADWVILSACNTAAGLDRSAPVFSGLATAFSEAGARNLLLSHWRVRDDAAARMSAGAIEGAARGLDRAEALRRAQVALMNDASVPGAAHPAIWAPFVLVRN